MHRSSPWPCPTPGWRCSRPRPAGLAGILVAAPVGAAARAAFVGVRELRALALAGALAIVATAWLARPLGDLIAAPAVFGLAYVAFAVAVAIRFGAIPFHLWAARVADAAPGVALPLLLAWGPAAFAAVALTWIDQSVAPLALDLGGERALIATIGAVSVVLGIIAAWIQDDLEHVVGYTIVADAGFVVLGLAAFDPAVWEPSRTWILVFVVGRSAFAAWAVAIHGGFGTRRLPELGGWARRAPVLALALVVIAVASVGWPGLVAWQARAELSGLSLPAWLAGTGGRRTGRSRRDLPPDPADRNPSPGRHRSNGPRRTTQLADAHRRAARWSVWAPRSASSSASLTRSAPCSTSCGRCRPPGG